MGTLPGFRQFYTMLGCGFIRESSMMHASITVFTVKDVMASLAYSATSWVSTSLSSTAIPPSMSACARAK